MGDKTLSLKEKRNGIDGFDHFLERTTATELIQRGATPIIETYAAERREDPRWVVWYNSREGALERLAASDFLLQEVLRYQATSPNATPCWINLTPHLIVENQSNMAVVPFAAFRIDLVENGGRRLVDSYGLTARIDEIAPPQRFYLDGAENIPVRARWYGEVLRLPPVTRNVRFLVSSMVMTRCQDRADVFTPGRLNYNARGEVTSCTGFFGTRALFVQATSC